MLRSKEKFYWSDALYAARSKDLLLKVEGAGPSMTYRCRACSAFVIYSVSEGNRSGRWLRVKPFEQFKMAGRTGHAVVEPSRLKVVSRPPGHKQLFQCEICASYWWREGDGWNKADDNLIDS